MYMTPSSITASAHALSMRKAPGGTVIHNVSSVLKLGVLTLKSTLGLLYALIPRSERGSLQNNVAK